MGLKRIIKGKKVWHSHKDGDRQHGFWCNDLEWESLKSIAQGFELKFTDFMKAIANGQLFVYKSANED